MSKEIQAHISLFFVALIFGANYTIAKDVMSEGYIEPRAFILMRASFGLLAFIIIHALFIKEKVDKKDFKRLILCGLFGVVTNQLMFFEGLKRTTQINASLLATTIPISVLIFSYFLTKEKITKQKLSGIGLGIVGAVLLIIHGKKIAYNSEGMIGDLMVFINAASYGLYLVLAKTLMTKYHPITVLKWCFTFGCMFLIPFGWSDFVRIEWNTFTNYIWIAVFYVLLFTTVLAYLLNNFALKNVNASVVGFYVYLQPLFATVIALFLGRDMLTIWKVAAGILIFTGVYFVSKK